MTKLHRKRFGLQDCSALLSIGDKYSKDYNKTVPMVTGGFQFGASLDKGAYIYQTELGYEETEYYCRKTAIFKLHVSSIMVQDNGDLFIFNLWVYKSNILDISTHSRSTHMQVMLYSLQWYSVLIVIYKRVGSKSALGFTYPIFSMKEAQATILKEIVP